MTNLAGRFAALKRRVGGNREKLDFEWTFGMPAEEQARVTPPNRQIVRILSEVNFALQLNEERGGVFGREVENALQILEDDMEVNGVLTRRACEEAEAALMPLHDAAREYELIFASHAHIDMNWMWGWQETVAATLATFRTVLNLMREYPDFTFSQSQASVYRIVEDYDPEMMEEMKTRIAEGRWEITASAWVETDKNMPDTESLIRHIRETRDYLKDNWGIDPDSVKVDFSPDTFGHSAFVPEINTFGGVKYYYHCRGLQDDLTLYRYRAPSGSEVLMYKEPYWYNSGVNPDCGTGIFGLSRRCAGLKTGLIVYGVGDHGGGPTRRDVERVLEMQAWPIFPAMRFGTIHEFFRKAESVYDQLPVIAHEINPIFAGCYTTQSRIKLGNRRSEVALLDAEKLCALAAKSLGSRYPAAGFHKAWRNVLFTHFHDILTGSCVQESREYAMGLFAEALAQAQSAEAKALRVLSEAVDTTAFRTDTPDDIRFTQSEGAGAGYGLASYAGVPNPERGAGKTRVYTVFNTASTARREPVELTIWDYTGDFSRLEVVDAAGQPLRFQLIDRQLQHYWDHKYIRLLVEADVPALGYTTCAVREKPVTDYPTYYLESERVEKPRGPVTLENERLTARFNGTNGMLLSLIDKRTGEELLAGPAGLYVTMVEDPGNSAWAIGRHLNTVPVNEMVSLRMLPAGELRQGFTAEYRALDSTFKVSVTLDADADALAYDLEVDWREYARAGEPRPVLRFVAPMRADASRVLMDVPAGAIVREAGHIDLPALTYAAAQADAATPALISNCKYGFRLADGALSCTLINTADNPDKYPERGIHAIKLWLTPASADAQLMKQRSEALNRPLTGVPTAVHEGKLPASGALMGFVADSAVLSAAFLDGTGALNVRAFETRGEESAVAVEVPFDIKAATLIDLDGRKVGEVEVSGRRAAFRLAPWKLGQVRIEG